MRDNGRCERGRRERVADETAQCSHVGHKSGVLRCRSRLLISPVLHFSLRDIHIADGMYCVTLGKRLTDLLPEVKQVADGGEEESKCGVGSATL